MTLYEYVWECGADAVIKLPNTTEISDRDFRYYFLAIVILQNQIYGVIFWTVPKKYKRASKSSLN